MERVTERSSVAFDFPKVEIIEEGMREGLQIEDALLSVDAKLKLLDALARSGLSTIVVGSFVSPKWTPQMADIDELVERITPVPGVTYTALALNEIGRERLRRHIPPLTRPRAGASDTGARVRRVRSSQHESFSGR